MEKLTWIGARRLPRSRYPRPICQNIMDCDSRGTATPALHPGCVHAAQGAHMHAYDVQIFVTLSCLQERAVEAALHRAVSHETCGANNTRSSGNMLCVSLLLHLEHKRKLSICWTSDSQKEQHYIHA